MNKMIYRIGSWSAMAAFVAFLLFFIVQVLQLVGTLHFPWDQRLIYGFSLCIPLPFLIAMLALHHTTPTEKRFWTHGALIFTSLYVAFVTANYVVQLATVIPMTVKGTAGEIQLLSQTPHSLFWDFDAIGYIFMGLAMLFAVPAFEKQGFQKWVGYSFLLHAAVTPLIAFVYFYPNFSDRLLLLATPWAITAPITMLLLTLYFRKNTKGSTMKKQVRLSILKRAKVVGQL
jgi:hypothetical protein